MWLSNRKARRSEPGRTSASSPGAIGQDLAHWLNQDMLVGPTDPPKPVDEASRPARKRAANPAQPIRPTTASGSAARGRHQEAADPFAEWWFEAGGDIDAADGAARHDGGYRPRPFPLGFVEIYLSPAAGTRRRTADGWNGFALDFNPPADLPSGTIAEVDGYVRPSSYENPVPGAADALALPRRWPRPRARRVEARDQGRRRQATLERAGHSLLPNGGKAIRFEAASRCRSAEAGAQVRSAARGRNRKPGRPEADRCAALPSADLILPDPHPPPDAAAAAPGGAAGAGAWSEI